jgi:hypothetical protein
LAKNRAALDSPSRRRYVEAARDRESGLIFEKVAAKPLFQSKQRNNKAKLTHETNKASIPKTNSNLCPDCRRLASRQSN